MLDSGENSPVLEASTHPNRDGLPANVRAALCTAKELFSTAKQQSMVMLQALYMRIQFGLEEECRDKEKQNVSQEVLLKWKELGSMRTEDLYINFALELALQNN